MIDVLIYVLFEVGFGLCVSVGDIVVEVVVFVVSDDVCNVLFSLFVGYDLVVFVDSYVFVVLLFDMLVNELCCGELLLKFLI